MEVRNSDPYISHFRITKRPTQKWVPTGMQNSQTGEELLQRVTDIPGFECEVTPYIGEIAAPASTFRFPSKAFFESARAEIVAKQVKTSQDEKAIESIDSMLSTDTIWAEDILAELGEGITLDGLWVDVFSDALDQFPSWAETDDEDGVGGIPIQIREHQWNARIPHGGAKSIELTVGLTTSTNQNPTTVNLVFEDAATKSQRQAVEAQLAANLAELRSQLAATPPEQLQTRKEIQGQIDSVVAQQNAQALVERGSMASLLSMPSVAQSLPAVLMTILMKLSAKHWPGMDLERVQARLGAVLTNLG